MYPLCNEDGTFHSILDTSALVFLTELFAGQLGLDGLRYVRGGEARSSVAGNDTVGELSPALAEILDR